MYCTVEANDRHEALRGLFATAELFVYYICKHEAQLFLR